MLFGGSPSCGSPAQGSLASGLVVKEFKMMARMATMALTSASLFSSSLRLFVSSSPRVDKLDMCYL